MHLSRWAEEHILFATQEYGFLHLPEAYATGSSAMPQKQNPDALELIRGKSGRVFGAATSVFVNLKGLPLAYNKDLQESQQPIFEAADAVLASLAIAAGFTRSVTATEAFDFARMRAACERGFMNAMAAATYLTGKGMPFRRAHEVIGKAVQQCVQRGCELLDLSLEELRGLAAEFDESFYAAVTVAAVVECHNVPGGTAMPQVRAALELARQRAGALLRRELKREEAHAHA
jgi:argininosuccinate lyase